MKKRLLTVMALMLVTVFSITAGPTAPATAQAPFIPEKATYADAQKAAAWQAVTQINTEMGSPWRGKHLKVRRPIEVFDLAGNHVAYLVEVLADDQPAGFVLVSAFLDEEPILSWTEGGSPLDPEQIQDMLGQDSNKVQSRRLVWSGDTRFAVRYEMKDGKVRHLDNKGRELAPGLAKAIPAPQEANVHVRRMWGVIKNIDLGDLGEQNPSDGVTEVDPRQWEVNYIDPPRKGYITAMDPYNQKQFDYDPNTSGNQWSGCAPTAGSNLMAYWAAKGYANLNPSGQVNITLALRTTMGTYQVPGSDGSTLGATTPTKIGSGLTKYVQNKGYTNFTGTTLVNPGYRTVTGHIDQGHPGLISFAGQEAWGDHTVTLVGYLEFTRTFPQPHSMYFVIRNNDDPSEPWNWYVRWQSWVGYSFDSVWPR